MQFSLHEYLEACKETWAKHTGHHPGKGGLQQEWFRRAVLEGLPEKIKEAMMANPDLPGSESHVWERHIVHHLQRAKDEETEKDKQIQELRENLLRLQLGEAKVRFNEGKKKHRQMAALGSGEPDTPDLYPVPTWAPQPHGGRGAFTAPYRPGTPRGGYGRGRGRGRGRGAPGAQVPYGVCFTCGDPNHWSRHCPQYTAGGRGYPNQGAAPVPNPHAVPPPSAPGQYPLSYDGGWDQE